MPQVTIRFFIADAVKLSPDSTTLPADNIHAVQVKINAGSHHQNPPAANHFQPGLPCDPEFRVLYILYGPDPSPHPQALAASGRWYQYRLQNNRRKKSVRE